MSYRKILERLVISGRKWVPVSRLGLEEDRLLSFADYVRRESGGMLEVLYDREPEKGETYAMVAMRIKSTSGGEIRRSLGIDNVALSFLLYLLFEEIKGNVYVPAEDIVHALVEKGIGEEGLSARKLVSKLEDIGLISSHQDEESGFIFVRSTALLRRLVDVDKMASALKELTGDDAVGALKKIFGRDEGETPNTEN